jgi:hypothetical protein
MSAQQINILEAVNQLMVRKSIATHKFIRALPSGVKASNPELQELSTFIRAARDRANYLMAQIG